MCNIFDGFIVLQFILYWLNKFSFSHLSHFHPIYVVNLLAYSCFPQSLFSKCGTWSDLTSLSPHNLLEHPSLFVNINLATFKKVNGPPKLDFSSLSLVFYFRDSSSDVCLSSLILSIFPSSKESMFMWYYAFCVMS